MKNILGILFLVLFGYIYYIDRFSRILLPHLQLYSFKKWIEIEKDNYFATTRVVVIHIVFGLYHLIF